MRRIQTPLQFHYTFLKSITSELSKTDYTLLFQFIVRLVRGSYVVWKFPRSTLYTAMESIR